MQLYINHFRLPAPHCTVITYSGVSVINSMMHGGACTIKIQINHWVTFVIISPLGGEDDLLVCLDKISEIFLRTRSLWKVSYGRDEQTQTSCQ